MKNIQVHHLGVFVKIRCEGPTRFVISDYSSGKRVRHIRATEQQAKEKAREVCAVLAHGKQHEREMLADSELKYDVLQAREILQPIRLRLSRAAQVVADCTELIPVDEIVAAARYWRDHRPDRKFTPIVADKAVDAYMARQSKLSERRIKTLNSIFSAFSGKFLGRTMETITAAELEDFIREKIGWKSPKTRNEARCAIRLLYEDAARRGWVPRNFNPAKELKTEKLKYGEVGVFLPAQVRHILNSLEDKLALPLAVWFFGSIRKENLARLQFSSLRSALQTGVLKISKDVDQKTGARTVPVEPNLKAWITWFFERHPNAEGCVLPSAGNIDNLSRKISLRSGIEWIDNGPRHSCISMRIARGDKVQDVAKAAGNSLVQIQRHYWNRDESLTAEVAKEYFSILPSSGMENVVRLESALHDSNKIGSVAANA